MIGTALARTAMSVLALGGEVEVEQAPITIANAQFDRVEEDFADRIIGLLRERVTPLYARLLHDVPAAIAALPPSAGHRGDAPDMLVVQRLLEQIRAQATGTLNESEMHSVARFYGQRLGVATRNELARQLRYGLGVDIPLFEGRSTDIIEHNARENAGLIRTIPTKLHGQVADLTIRAFMQRMGPDRFAELLQERFGVAESAARFLATDQLGKLGGQLDAERNQQLGITHYKWRTRRDDRVRKRHRALEGRRFAYEDPPPRGSGGLPGQDYGCRCRQQPDLSNVLAAIREARRFPSQFSAPLAGSLR